MDAIRIGKKGARKVLPTDISETLLEESKKRGYIKEYSIENAECLSFPDNSFDYVFCKESLHHFPRPYMGLYEMLRVARKAVFLVEPNDFIKVRLAHSANTVNAVKKVIALIFKTVFTPKKSYYAALSYPKPDWEEGPSNYVFRVSRREIEKIALGLNYPHVVFKGINFHYVAGCEYEPADAGKSKIFREMLDVISARDKRCLNGKRDYDVLMTAIHKTPLDAGTRELYDRNGYDIVDLPGNPYIDQ